MRCKSLNPRWKDQRGITGLETVIELVAFAALSTGVFSSYKAKETIQACLPDTRGSIELKGSVVATSEDCEARRASSSRGNVSRNQKGEGSTLAFAVSSWFSPSRTE